MPCKLWWGVGGRGRPFSIWGQLGLLWRLLIFVIVISSLQIFTGSVCTSVVCTSKPSSNSVIASFTSHPHCCHCDYMSHCFSKEKKIPFIKFVLVKHPVNHGFYHSQSFENESFRHKKGLSYCLKQFMRNSLSASLHQTCYHKCFPLHMWYCSVFISPSENDHIARSKHLKLYLFMLS